MRKWRWRVPMFCVVFACVACESPLQGRGDFGSPYDRYWGHSGEFHDQHRYYGHDFHDRGFEDKPPPPGYYHPGPPELADGGTGPPPHGGQRGPERSPGPPPPPPPPPRPPRRVGVARELRVMPAPLPHSDHELQLNVSWAPPLGRVPADYSLEVRGTTPTTDCATSICYEYGIPAEATWWLVPDAASEVEGAGCSVRPACAYSVRLMAHPWDGRTAATLQVELDECVAGVCSCGHASRLPRPQVSAEVVATQDDILTVNVSWSQPPGEKRGLPPHLMNDYYFVSVGRQLVTSSQVGLTPWYAHEKSMNVRASGSTVDGDIPRSITIQLKDSNLPERGGSENRPPGRDRGSERERATVRERPTSDQEGDRDVKSPGERKIPGKLMARVALVDKRGCMGPFGNFTILEQPQEAGNSGSGVGTYMAWAVVWAACALGAACATLVGARRVKRALAAWRAPAAVPSPLRRHPAWLPLQGRTTEEVGAAAAEAGRGGHEEHSPLYVEKEIEELGDPWEVSWSRVKLGALIGRGAFGRVHIAHVTLPATVAPVTVAVKMLDADATAEEKADFLREIEIQKSVGTHEHVIRLVACCTRHAPLAALLEHARGDLLALLRAARRADPARARPHSVDTSGTPSGRPSEADTEYTNLSIDSMSKEDAGGKEAASVSAGEGEEERGPHYVAEPALRLDGATMREYALQVALGMQHLEKLGITHRDLAARNILVDAVGVLKVADFGLSRAGVYVHTRSRPVPLRWLAPEAILQSSYSSASDVWAYAVLLWEIATLGGFPYSTLSNQEVLAFLSVGGRLDRPARASPRLYDLMLSCWADEQRSRPTFADIVSRLRAHSQLYVDMDCVFPALEEEVSRALREEDFSFNSSPDLSPVR